MSSISLELIDALRYGLRMPKEPHHPDRAQIDLSAVLEALSEPTRRDIVLRLADEGEAACMAFDECGPKTNLSYHFARLREAGVTRVRLDGPYRMISLRRDDLAARFPGLLDSILAAARAAADSPARDKTPALAAD
jgi:DNA-binding transcriptional ArsR family regulator